MSVELNRLLQARGRTHGDYEVHAALAQDLKVEMRARKGWNNLSATQRETLEMIAHKIGRIIAGDPNHKDHWDDIAGYAQLSANRAKAGVPDTAAVALPANASEGEV